MAEIKYLNDTKEKNQVLNELSKEILSGKVTTDSIILLDAFDDKMVFRNQSDLVGS